METSLRLRGDGGGLRIHAKEKLPLPYNSLLQAHGELDTAAAAEGGTAAPAPSYLALFVRHFYPKLSADIGVGVQLHNGDELAYALRAKKAIPFTSTGLLGINLKGRLLADKEFKPVTLLCSLLVLCYNACSQSFAFVLQLRASRLCFLQRKRTGAVELAWTILDFRKGQDVRLKVGYEMYYKVPYFQLSENSWTLNASMDGKWDVRFDM